MSNKFVITQMPKYSIVSFILLNILSMYFYLGGNMNNPEQLGCSFFSNFYSDLGMTVSHSNQDNLLSCLLFNSSLCIIGICFTLLFFFVKNTFTSYKKVSLIATFFGIFGSFCYIGVAFTPSNLYLEYHTFFAHWIFRSLFISSILYAFLIINTHGFDNKYAYGFIIFSIMVLFYVLYSELVLNDPRLFPESLYKHVIAQKMIVFWILIAVYLYSVGIGAYLVNKNNK